MEKAELRACSSAVVQLVLCVLIPHPLSLARGAAAPEAQASRRASGAATVVWEAGGGGGGAIVAVPGLGLLPGIDAN